jgi:hypothetical protein
MNSLFLTSTPGYIQVGSLIVTALLGYLIYYKKKEDPDRNFLLEFFAGSLVEKLELVAFYTTASECVGLIIIALARGVDLFNALVRYTIFCGVEIAVIYFFIMWSTRVQRAIITRVAKTVLADKHINPFEIIKMFIYFCLYLVVALAIFPVFTLPTLAITYLYLESIGAVSIEFVQISPFLWEMFDIVKNPDHEIGILEGAALGLIWFTPILTLLQIIFTPFEVWADVAAEIMGKKEKDKEEKKKNKKKKKKKNIFSDDEDDDWGEEDEDDDEDINSDVSKMTEDFLKGQAPFVGFPYNN